MDYYYYRVRWKWLAYHRIASQRNGIYLRARSIDRSRCSWFNISSTMCNDFACFNCHSKKWQQIYAYSTGQCTPQTQTFFSFFYLFRTILDSQLLPSWSSESKIGCQILHTDSHRSPFIALLLEKSLFKNISFNNKQSNEINRMNRMNPTTVVYSCSPAWPSTVLCSGSCMSRS
jgi:hypothetical protein